MIKNGHVILSDDIMDEFFLCDLAVCKGACCVEGDLGAPLEESELLILDEIYNQVEPYLTKKGKTAIEDQGKYVLDSDGDYSTPTINNKECAYAVYNEQGVLQCGIEKAFFDERIKFRKPISCHLYPIRATHYEDIDALNYDRWHICESACINGNSIKLPLYQFLKEPLIRQYGHEWYNNLVSLIDESDKVN